MIITVPFPSPNNISLSMANTGQLTFTWSSSTQNCPALKYNIISSNCGSCSSNTAANSVTCSDVRPGATTLANTCTFIVQTAVCDDILGATSIPLVILITG